MPIFLSIKCFSGVLIGIPQLAAILLKYVIQNTGLRGQRTLFFSANKITSLIFDGILSNKSGLYAATGVAASIAKAYCPL